MKSSNDAHLGGAPGIGERLRSAREARGLTLEAVASELRIRVSILGAMEREEHAALPERVYLLGLLRTYARFLGLDPAAVAAGWAGEPIRSDAPPPSTRGRVGGQEGLRHRIRQSLRSALGLGFAGLILLGAVGFLSAQVIRFAQPPAIAVTSPAEEVVSLAAGTPATTLRGTAGVGTQILIQNAIGNSMTTEADVSGVWSIEVPLSGGRNEFDISAADPATGSASGAATRRVFIVALPVNDAPQLEVLSPTAGLRVSGGPVPISLSTASNAQVAIVATSGTGETLSSTFPAQADGRLQADLLLPQGSWRLSLQVASPTGTVSEVVRDVEVVFAGVTVTLTGRDVGTWIRVWVDGIVDPATGPSGVTLRRGETRTVRGVSNVEIRFGNPRGALIALNGRMLGEQGTAGVAESWSYRADGRVLSSSRR